MENNLKPGFKNRRALAGASVHTEDPEMLTALMGGMGNIDPSMDLEKHRTTVMETKKRTGDIV